MERMIHSGHKIIFATSYGYLDEAIELGEKYPKVAFLHAGGLKTCEERRHLLGGFGRRHVPRRHGGRSVSKTGKLGFVGAFPDPAAPALASTPSPWAPRR